VRVGDDGFLLRETVAEYVQILRLRPDELRGLGYADPGERLLPRDREVFLYGGGVLIFDEFGRLKFHVHNRLENFKLQSERLRYLATKGFYEQKRPVRKPTAKLSEFGMLHLERSLGGIKYPGKAVGSAADSEQGHEHGTEGTMEEGMVEDETP